MRYDANQLSMLPENEFMEYYRRYVTYYQGLTDEQKQMENQYASIVKNEYTARKQRAQQITPLDFEMPEHPAYAPKPQVNLSNESRIICPNCGSNNVTIQMQQIAGKTSKHGTGLGGKLNNTARAITAISTLGMSNLVWKKSKGTEKTKYINQKVCVCQSCGNSWEIK